MDRRSFDLPSDEPEPHFVGVPSASRVLCLAWAIVVAVGFVNLARAPFATEAVGWLAVEWISFVVASLVLTAGVMLLPAALLLITGHGLRVSVVGVVLVAITIACLPVERVWFEGELANGPVPLAQAMLMKPVQGREAVYEPPALYYSETCCG
jgi:hypothetical protein